MLYKGFGTEVAEPISLQPCYVVFFNQAQEHLGIMGIIHLNLEF